MRNYNGFTLVEVLIYSFLLGLIVIGFVSFALVVSGAKNKNLAMQAVNADAHSIFSVLEREIRQANAVVIPSKGNNSSVLQLSMPGSSQVSYYTDNKILFRQADAGSPLAVMDSRAAIDNIVFSNLSGAGEPDNIKIELALETASRTVPEFSYEQNFQTAVGVRQ